MNTRHRPKMEINVPNFVHAALPERATRNRNAIILSENTNGRNSHGSLHSSVQLSSSSFPRAPHKLFVTAEGPTFDESALAAWRAEGFAVEYFGLPDDEGAAAAYDSTLAGLKDRARLGPCESYALVAFGEAAARCLAFFHGMGHNAEFKLAALVAYYPSRIPDPRAVFPGGLRVVVHLAADEGEGGVGVVLHSQVAGFQGKRRVARRAVGGTGVGGRARVAGAACAYPCYWYEAAPGFAEGDLEAYEGVAAGLAWSRSLGVVCKALGVECEVEGVVERNLEAKFQTRNLQQTMATYTTHKPPHATYFPTLSGGVNAQELQRFYADYFLTTHPASTKLTLLSRTAGADRVVDELHVAFRHTQEMPWILPGVPPTNRRVEVAVVSVVTLRGGRLYHEHVYWDQASVLVQVGLLDPKVVPEKARAKGVRALPVVGREAARRLVRGFEDDEGDEGEADNELLPGWYDDDDDEEEGDGVGKGDGGDGVEEGREKSDLAPKANGKEVERQNGEDSSSSENRTEKKEEEVSPPVTQPAGGDVGEKSEVNEESADDNNGVAA
ncbi:hypothetical protein F4825DRAFT_470121 [Nemania diffusa]|nr:hypothetical protein F4825DRAFT_470121 [Nemania diffusa]